MLFVKRAYDWRNPRGRMHTVGDGSDWDFPDSATGKHVVPESARHLAVFAANAVRRATRFYSERRQPETLRVIVRFDATQIQKLFVRQIKLFLESRAETFFDELRVELIIACRDGRMSREHAKLAHMVHCLTKINLFLLHYLARQFQSEKS